jgi:hypothetical protein
VVSRDKRHKTVNSYKTGKADDWDNDPAGGDALACGYESACGYERVWGKKVVKVPKSGKSKEMVNSNKTDKT